MARGSIAKETITKKILETFEGSFKNDKEIRIPVMEDGELVQIKITLTAAKTNIDNPAGGDTTKEIKAEKPVDNIVDFPSAVGIEHKAIVEPTEEEKENLQNLINQIF